MAVVRCGHLCNAAPIKELEMKASVYCTTRTIEQTEAIVSDLKRAAFGGGEIYVLLPDLRSTHDFAHRHGTRIPEGAAMDSPGRILQDGMLVSVQVQNPNQRNAASDIFQQHDAEDITTGSEAHAALQ